MTAARPKNRFVHSQRVRVAACAYVGASVAAAFVLGSGVDGRTDYFGAWALVTIFPIVPALLVAPRTLRDVAPRERTMWRLWAVGWTVVYLDGPIVYLIGVNGWTWLAMITLPAAVVRNAGFGVGNTAALRQRAGQRAPQVDLVDMTTGVLAAAGPLVLLFADRVLAADHAWFTVPAALSVVGLVYCCIAMLVVSLRVPPERRGLLRIALGYVVLALVDAAAQAAQGTTGFTLPAAPLLGLHALVVGGSLLAPAFAMHEGAPGVLERLPPQRQVRKNGILAVVVLTGMTLTAGIVVARRDEGWVVVAAVGLMMVLLALSTIRQLLLARETVRLYGEVERAADERRELLAEVMQSLDTDHHRAAVHLHKQAASLYTAMASFAQALDWLPGHEVPPAVGIAAERVRFDLARRVDASQQILTAIEPGATGQDGLLRLIALTRAYVGNLWGDARRPELLVDVDERLAVDWTHEVVVFRIVQMAVHNVWRHADARTIEVSMSAPDDALVVEVTDDGVGFEPATVEVGSGITTMQTLVSYVDGHVEIDSAAGRGTRVTAVVGAVAPRPRLRVVPSSS
jgi:signal transduction histidine kinase